MDNLDGKIYPWDDMVLGSCEQLNREIETLETYLVNQPTDFISKCNVIYLYMKGNIKISRIVPYLESILQDYVSYKEFLQNDDNYTHNNLANRNEIQNLIYHLGIIVFETHLIYWKYDKYLNKSNSTYHINTSIQRRNILNNCIPVLEQLLLNTTITNSANATSTITAKTTTPTAVTAITATSGTTTNKNNKMKNKYNDNFKNNINNTIQIINKSDSEPIMKIDDKYFLLLKYKLGLFYELTGKWQNSLLIMSELITKQESNNIIDLSMIIFKAAMLLKEFKLFNQSLEYLEYIIDDHPQLGIMHNYVFIKSFIIGLITIIYSQLGNKYQSSVQKSYITLTRIFQEETKKYNETMNKLVIPVFYGVNDQSSDIWELLAIQALDICEYLLAIDYLKQALIKINPQNVNKKGKMLCILSEVYFIVNQLELCKKYGEEAMKFIPDCIELRNLLLLVAPEVWTEKLRLFASRSMDEFEVLNDAIRNSGNKIMKINQNKTNDSSNNNNNLKANNDDQNHHSSSSSWLNKVAINTINIIDVSAASIARSSSGDPTSTPGISTSSSLKLPSISPSRIGRIGSIFSSNSSSQSNDNNDKTNNNNNSNNNNKSILPSNGTGNDSANNDLKKTVKNGNDDKSEDISNLYNQSLDSSSFDYSHNNNNNNNNNNNFKTNNIKNNKSSIPSIHTNNMKSTSSDTSTSNNNTSIRLAKPLLDEEAKIELKKLLNGKSNIYIYDQDLKNINNMSQKKSTLK
eukprot:gene10461-14052_t